MKKSRQIRIVELLESHVISKQEDLQAYLEGEGYVVNQATISRDIKELKITKQVGADGVYRYTVSDEPADALRKYRLILSEAILKVAAAQNIVVVKCHIGMANAACAAFDYVIPDAVVGTIAGDDTFLIICSDSISAQTTAQKLEKILKTSR